MRILARQFALLLAVLSICTGCVTQEMLSQCVSQDWYKRGFDDASAGYDTSQFLSHHNRCAPHGITPHRTDYLAGWTAGRERPNPS